MILFLAVVTLLVVGGVLALRHRPAWATPVATTLTAMTLMVTAVGVLIAVTRSWAHHHRVG
ncbi:hypothetical protein [Streptomyces aureoversilis]|uniref:Uncharacterized protein n=1 Tax=Streptomyces aureoversilis TaxID=67277 RepID=A0ABV9ZV87_9ACTN